jgi:hypothetical protein
MAPRGVRANADWRPPPELSRDLPRPGAPEAWQALDRSFDALLAALDEPKASCADHARAYTEVGRAARQVADGLAGATVLELAAGCSFCAKRREDVGRLIAGPDVYVCDECVALCVELMEEEVGPDWRGAGGSSAARRGRGGGDPERQRERARVKAALGAAMRPSALWSGAGGTSLCVTAGSEVASLPDHRRPRADGGDRRPAEVRRLPEQERELPPGGIDRGPCAPADRDSVCGCRTGRYYLAHE